MKHARVAVMVMLVLAARGLAAEQGKIVPLINAHSHNDYEHTRPCLDALSCGFGSIEADIYLVDGKLLVAHDRNKVRPERTLEALYLDPLAKQVQANGGRVYAKGPNVTLLIDIKTEAEPTYAALREVLKRYAPMLIVFKKDQIKSGAVMVIISGNRPGREMLAAEAERYVGYDGRLEDLEVGDSPNLVPLISSNWVLTFKWRGAGEIPAAERQKLRGLVEKAHAQGKRIRFWGAPDNPAGWTELRAAGVDLINTDKLEGLRDFLLKSAPQP